MTAASPVILNLDRVTHVYPGRDENNAAVEAIHDVSLELRQGDFVCLLGPSGCGKTSLLRVMAGYTQPESGTATWHGTPITGPSHTRGVMFQQANLYPWLTCAENVAFGPRMQGKPSPEIASNVERLLHAVHLDGFADALPSELSGGMQQRTSLARALANEPELLLMDEPFGALDALTRIEMQNLIRDLSLETIPTIFMITHDIDEALSLADRVLVMSHRPGRILKEFQVDYSARALEAHQDRVTITPEYLALRDEIFTLLTRHP